MRTSSFVQPGPRTSSFSALSVEPLNGDDCPQADGGQADPFSALSVEPLNGAAAAACLAGGVAGLSVLSLLSR